MHNISEIARRVARTRHKGNSTLMIAKDFLLMKEKHRMRCFSFTIMETGHVRERTFPAERTRCLVPPLILWRGRATLLLPHVPEDLSYFREPSTNSNRPFSIFLAAATTDLGSDRQG